MWFEIPERKYKYFPAKTVGTHAYRFRNSKGRFTKFRKGSRLTLFLSFKKPVQFLDWVAYLTDSKPPAKKVKKVKKTKKAATPAKTRKKPAKAPSRARKPLTKAEKARRKAAKAKKVKILAEARARLKTNLQWVSADNVFADLQARYSNLEMDHKGVALKGWKYIGDGPYKDTYWSTRDIVPQDVKSVFIFVVIKIDGYDGASGNHILAGKQIDWKAHTDDIMERFLEPSRERLMTAPGVYKTQTNLDMLIRTLFRKKIGTANIKEYVGLRFAHTKAPPPPTNRNPHKKKKRKRK